MNRIARLAGALVATALATTGALLAQERAVDLDARPGAAIVLFHDSVADPAGEAARLARDHGLRVRYVYTNVFPGFSAEIPQAAREALARSPLVAEIAPDRRTFRIGAQTTPTGISRIGAPAAISGGWTGLSARVAVIDTGVDLDHPDLAANVEASLSRTFVSFFSAPPGGRDDHGHGTHVAGTVAALDNAIDVVGVAPRAKIVSVKVLSAQGFGWESDIVAGIDYIAGHNRNQTSYAGVIHVANMSLGGPGDDGPTPIHRAIQACVATGTTFCVAAGNDSADAAGYEPASYDEVVTVSALDARSDTFASFSNYGADVDVIGPGVAVLSTRLGGGTTVFSGTSMATPHASGTAAQFVAANLGALGSMWAADPASVPPYVQSQILAAVENADGSHGSPGATGWSGDPDAYHEGLVDVDELLGLAGPADPAVRVAVATDKGTYDRRTDSAVGIVVSVEDETGTAIPGLAGAAFRTFLDGAEIAVAYVESSPGSYQGSTPVPVAGTHSLRVEVTDPRALTGSGTTSFTVVDPPANAIHVGRIDYSVKGSTLYIRIRIDDANGAPVSGAAVDIDVYRNGVFYASGAGAVTGSDGVAAYRGRNAPSGQYATDVTRVAKSGTTWDQTQDAADPGYYKK